MKRVSEVGDIFNSKADIIAHQVNSCGVMGSGIAKQVRDKFPRVWLKYRKSYEDKLLKPGTCQVVETEEGSGRYIANLCGQTNFGYDGGRYTNYESIYSALEKLANYCKENDIKSVAFPYHMSCDRGGAKWKIINAMIESVFEDNDNIKVEVWIYSDKV